MMAHPDSPSSPPYSGLLLTSLMVMLNLPVIFTLITGMDQYGFFTLDPVAAQPWPLALSLVLSISAAGAGYFLYRFLWSRRSWFVGSGWGPFRRNAVLFGAPVALAFSPGLFLTSYGRIPTGVGVAVLMAGSLCITAALKDGEMQLDSGMARIWFGTAIAAILVMLALSVFGMLMLFSADHLTPTGNFFWTWEFSWSDLGYPPDQFSQRQRDAALVFAMAGSGYMIVALGGNMLDAIIGWARTPGPPLDSRPQHRLPHRSSPISGRPADGATGRSPRDFIEEAPGWAAPILENLGSPQYSVPDEPWFIAVLNGHETEISRSQYERLVAEKDNLLHEAGLLVDKVSGNAFAQSRSGWQRIPFRGKRKGPFLLLCIYARHPGKQFTISELETLLEADLVDREDPNVGDFLGQLQKSPWSPSSATTTVHTSPRRQRSASWATGHKLPSPGDELPPAQA